MSKYLVVLCVCIAFALGMLLPRPQLHAAAAAMMTQNSPSQGWTLHIDAKRHFGTAHPGELAHHWCKTGLAGGLIECQIYDSDAPNARLVAIETIVQPGVYNSFSASEKALWHWHRTEVPKVDATLPGMPLAQQKKVVASILPTYGKVWILWDPIVTNNMPIGRPWVGIVK